MARHTDSLPFRDLFRGAKMLLSDDGVFSVIVPSEVLEVVVSEACMLGFILSGSVALRQWSANSLNAIFCRLQSIGMMVWKIL